jgi:Zn-dependent M16 (insulinase) family peptidase
MDAPLSVSQKANTAVTYYFNKVSREDQQSLRDAVLNTSMDDIKSLRKMLKAVLEQNAYCVYGNDEKISEQKDLFGSIEKIIR